MKRGLVALVGLYIVLIVCGSVYALEYTHNSTDGTYNVTGGTASAYYSSAPIDYSLPYFRYFNYKETSDQYITLLDVDVSTMNMGELLNTVELCNRTINYAAKLLGNFNKHSSGHLPLWCMIDFHEFLKINEVADVLVHKWKEASSRLAEMGATGYPDINNTVTHYPDIFFLEGDYDARYNYVRFIDEFNRIFITRGIKTEPGNYDSTKVIVPIENCTMEFETRTLEDFDILYENMTTEVGSGKNYHTEEFQVGEFEMTNLASDEYNPLLLQISIAQYIGPSRYEPSNPFDGYKAVNYNAYDHLDTETIEVDGHSALLYSSYYTKNNKRPNRYAVTFALDANTFVMIKTSMADYDKDVSLWIETLHIEKNNTTDL